MGRPTELTPEIANGIILALRTGAPIEVAAESQGVAAATFYEWVRRGEGTHPTRPSTPAYAEFAERVARAKAEAHLLAVGTIRGAINRGSWQAALAWLKMRYPKDYAERFEHTGPEGSPIAVEIAQALEGLSEEELASIEQHLAASRAAGPPPVPGRRRTRAKEPRPPV